MAATGSPQTPTLVGFSLEDLQTDVFPERKPLLMRGDTPVFREGHLGETYGSRGFGNTWFLKTMALVAVSGGDALGFHAPTPCRVLDVDGEMASQNIKDWYALLAGHLGISVASSLQIVAADWQEGLIPRLDRPEGQAALEPFVDNADLIFFDNRSCLFDPEGESDPGARQPAQDYLLSLRRRGKAVMLAHHSNRQGGARGHRKPEDPMNLLINLTRPEGYSHEQGARFVVTFEKSRGAYGAAVAPFTAQRTADGWKTVTPGREPSRRRQAD